jgi:hypothetical protein
MGKNYGNDGEKPDSLNWADKEGSLLYIRPTRLGGFSGTKAYIQYVEIPKIRRNAAGGLFATPSRFT